MSKKSNKNHRTVYRRRVQITNMLKAALERTTHEDDLSIPLLRKEDLFRDLSCAVSN